MSHPHIESKPLLEERNQSNNNDTSTPNNATVIRTNFLFMTVLFAINHGCTVSCLDLANARLGSIGVWQSGMLYLSYTLSALCGASYVVKRLGSRNGLILGMGMNAGYVSSFFLVSMIVEKNEGVGWLHKLVAVVSAIVGGIGGSILWVSQGGYFSSASELFAAASYSSLGQDAAKKLEDVTSRFGGDFAFAFLLFEVLLRLSSSFIIKTAGVSWKVVFGLYSILSIIPVVLMMGVSDLKGYQTRYSQLRTEYGIDEGVVGFEEEGRKNNLPNNNKATATLDLLRTDPKAKYLSPLNILFGLSTSFCSSVLNGAVIRQVLDDPSSTFVGLFTSITSIVASVASLLFGILQSSSQTSFLCGKGLIMTIGALSYLIIACQFVAFPDGNDWNRLSLLLVYVLLGVGRSTFEGTLRAIYADYFPDEKEGAFGNIILFSGTASTIGYVLSVTGALTCEEESEYCMKYNDGSIHNVRVMEYVIIATAVVSIPALWRADW
eukprot:CAMPEP_0183710420 /NCGR_PEP_ID=MMETSP0737-20130205/6161_1 /TAXON_ID=385413 /ORGANISM="Thalassiosira miniscula, Strain CCMP1093" /LENGTH=492 /DNA_ID=CAMNT_0025938689 /DNA_START=103 /DNA_END=1578 /DNA_ORIENTATION=-